MHMHRIMEMKTLSDGEIAVRFRCCNEELSDSWLTIHNAHELDEAGIDAVIQAHGETVSARHGKMEAASAHVQRLIDTAV